MTSKQEGNNPFVAFNEQLCIWDLRQCKTASCWLNIILLIRYSGNAVTSTELSQQKQTESSEVVWFMV